MVDVAAGMVFYMGSQILRGFCHAMSCCLGRLIATLGGFKLLNLKAELLDVEASLEQDKQLAMKAWVQLNCVRNFWSYEDSSVLQTREETIRKTVQR